METRICRYCQGEHPIDYFELANVINGKEYRRWKCKSCYGQMKQDRRVRMRLWFDNYKKTLKCQECGLQDHRVLEFHHGDDNKEANVSDWVSNGRRSTENIEREIKKCKVLCANCHRILHYEERNGQRA